MKRILSTAILLVIVMNLFGQKAPSPYEWDWKVDGPWTGLSLLGSGYGLSLIINKKGINENQLQAILNDKDNINFLDRWAAGNYSETAGKLSDIPFYLSFAAPLVLFFDDEVNDNGGQVLGIFLESMATTGTIYGITAGFANRSRPYVYNEKLGLNRRLKNNGQRSFFSGHTAATATSTFFVAKVYQDFNPGSPGIPYVWAGAITLPALVGYLRIEAGQHFLTDVLIGYGVGALVGYFTPELHKVKNTSLGIEPTMATDFEGNLFPAFSLNYRF